MSLSRRSRRIGPYRRLAIGLVLGYLLIAAAYAGISASVLAAGHWHVSFQHALLPRLNDVVVFTFFLVCGGSVGSFLNVVAWRMPQGLSVNGHSFCPRCRHPLRARDNVPVLGWLWIGGRCRDCRLPISSRYPIVEAAVALTFAFLGTAELYGWNLPFRPLPSWDGLASPLIRPDVLPILLFHLVGISIAWSMGLIRYDKNAIPAKLIAFSGIWLVGGLLVFPSFALVPWQLSLPASWPPSNWLVDWLWADPHYPVDNVGQPALGYEPSDFLQVLMRIMTAVVAAGFYARVLAKAFCPTADLKLDPMGSPTLRLLDLMYLISVVALLVGWQATPSVLLGASILAYGLQRAVLPGRSDALGYFSLAMPIALMLQMLLWRWSLQWGWWSYEQVSRPFLLATAIGTLLIPLWLKEPRRSSTFRSEELLDELKSEN